MCAVDTLRPRKMAAVNSHFRPRTLWLKSTLDAPFALAFPPIAPSSTLPYFSSPSSNTIASSLTQPRLLSPASPLYQTLFVSTMPNPPSASNPLATAWSSLNAQVRKVQAALEAADLTAGAAFKSTNTALAALSPDQAARPAVAAADATALATVKSLMAVKAAFEALKEARARLADVFVTTEASQPAKEEEQRPADENDSVGE